MCRAIIALVISAAVCVLLGSRLECFAETVQRADNDLLQAKGALHAYLDLRRQYDQDYGKRYDMLSEGAQQLLRNTYGVVDSGGLEKFEGDLAGFGDYKILTIKQVQKGKVRAKVRIEIITEHPDGAIAQDEMFTCVVKREGGEWKLDQILRSDGTPHWP